MDSKINQGSYKVIETIWAESLQKGQNVTTSIHLEYAGNSFRPSVFDISYRIDNGELIETILKNGL